MTCGSSRALGSCFRGRLKRPSRAGSAQSLLASVTPRSVWTVRSNALEQHPIVVVSGVMKAAVERSWLYCSRCYL